MKITQRFHAVSISHPFSMNKKLDEYLSEHLPTLIDEYKIADRSDLDEVEKIFLEDEGRMDSLDAWRNGFDDKIAQNEKRIKRLKVKFGMKEAD